MKQAMEEPSEPDNSSFPTRRYVSPFRGYKIDQKNSSMNKNMTMESMPEIFPILVANTRKFHINFQFDAPNRNFAMEILQHRHLDKSLRLGKDGFEVPMDLHVGRVLLSVKDATEKLNSLKFSLRFRMVSCGEKQRKANRLPYSVVLSVLI